MLIVCCASARSLLLANKWYMFVGLNRFSTIWVRVLRSTPGNSVSMELTVPDALSPSVPWETLQENTYQVLVAPCSYLLRTSFLLSVLPTGFLSPRSIPVFFLIVESGCSGVLV